MQSADGAQDDWLTKWQTTAGSFGVQAQRNEMSTSQPDIGRDKSAHERINEAYFDSYGFFGIHREMISDKVWLASNVTSFKSV